MTATLNTYGRPLTTEASLKTLDLLGFIVAAVITLGPLAATALFTA